MRRIISLAVVALGFFAGINLQAQVRVAGATNFHESCCAIGIRGPSVPVGGSGRRFSGDFNQQRQFHNHDGLRRDGFRHNRFGNGVGGLGFGGYPIYYNPYGYYDTETTDQPQPAANNYEQPAEDSGPGLTVFERRRDYRLIGDSPQYQSDQQTDARDEKSAGKSDGVDATAAAPPEELVSTILIFRDGSHRELRNYALMGSSIYDLSVKPGEGKMRIMLGDLDIPATIAANEQRGIEFRVPSTP